MALLTNIEDDAFNTPTFRYMYSLTLTNLAMHSLGPRTLRGLNNLRNLELRSSRLIQFPPILQAVSKTIYYVHISGNDVSRSQIQSIDQLSNGLSIHTLEQLRLHLNLKDSLSRRSFVRFASISFLELSNCRIKVLDKDMFYPIRNSLTFLDLSGNYLTTLPFGMFTYLLLRKKMNFNLENNPWHCNCHLLELQRALIRYPESFYFNLFCQEPTDFTKTLIKEAHFCGQPDGMTQSYLSKSLLCRLPQKVHKIYLMKIIRKRSKTFGIQRFNDDSMHLTILEEYLPSKMVYILDGANCLNSLRSIFALPTSKNSTSVLIDSRMKQSQMQMICIQGMKSFTTDCTTIWSPKKEHVLSLKRHYGYIILALVLLLSLATGGFFGYVFAKKIILLSPVWSDDEL